MSKWCKKILKEMEQPNDKRYLQWCAIELAKAIDRRKYGST